MSMTPDEFSTLSDSDKLVILFSQLTHLRRNTLAANEARDLILEAHEKRLRTHAERLVTLETHARWAGAIALVFASLVGVGLARALGWA